MECYKTVFFFIAKPLIVHATFFKLTLLSFHFKTITLTKKKKAKKKKNDKKKIKIKKNLFFLRFMRSVVLVFN